MKKDPELAGGDVKRLYSAMQEKRSTKPNRAVRRMAAKMKGRR